MRNLVSAASLVVACLAPLAVSGENASVPADAHSMAAAYNSTGQKLMRTFVEKPGNVVFSPLSIGSAMTMATHGARSATREEMLRILAMTGVASSGAGDLMHVLNSYDASAASVECPSFAKPIGEKCGAPPNADGRCPVRAELKDGLCLSSGSHKPAARVSIANSLMILRDGISADYASDLKREYDAEVFQKPSPDAINGWVKSKTGGRIEKMLENPPGPNDVAILLNAAYFRARWASAFSKQQTKDAPFWVAGKTSALVPTMHQIARLEVVKGDGFRAIRLPYTVEQLGMVIVVPDATDGVDAIGAKLDDAAFSKFVAALNAAPAKRINLAMPKFKIKYDASLVPSFKALGMQLPFGMKADFSGMTDASVGASSLYINQIIHRAVIDVDEEGTEATAATAIIFAIRAMPQKQEEPEPFMVDRPFLFYVTDKATGSILFQGRVTDPRAS